VFRGLSQLSLDAKGRLSLPSRYRERLQSYCHGELVLTVDPTGGCLWLYPLPEWESVEAKVMSLSSFNPETRAVQRLIVGHAHEVCMDGSGRILVPPTLRDFASIEQKVALVGQMNKFELWDEATWAEKTAVYREEVPKNLESVPELQGLSL
jgi:MraZ protein